MFVLAFRLQWKVFVEKFKQNVFILVHESQFNNDLSHFVLIFSPLKWKRFNGKFMFVRWSFHYFFWLNFSEVKIRYIHTMNKENEINSMFAFLIQWNSANVHEREWIELKQIFNMISKWVSNFDKRMRLRFFFPVQTDGFEYYLDKFRYRWWAIINWERNNPKPLVFPS